MKHQSLGPLISSGNREFDELLGGGFHTASVTLISGEAGTGKTTFVCTFAKTQAEKGNRILYISFEESEEAIVSSMLSPGIDLRPSIQSGKLKVIPVMPESTGSEQHLIKIIREIEQFHPKYIILDAISALSRMGDDTSFDFLIRLTNLCRIAGITMIMTNQLEEATKTLTGFGFSSLLDTIVSLEYIRATSEMNRVIHVIKSRGAHHSNEFREYHITDQGIRIEKTFAGEGMMLTGINRKIHEAQDKYTQLQRKIDIEQMKREVDQLKVTKQAEIANIQNEIKNAEQKLTAMTRRDNLVKETHSYHIGEEKKEKEG